MNAHVATIVLLISIAFLWCYLFWLYTDFRVDQFRQQLFAVRDEMFDAAADGKISFDDEAYGIVRVTTNGFIRFAHMISISHVLATVWAVRSTGALPRVSCNIMEAFNDLPPHRRKIYIEYKRQINRIVIRHIILRSPFLALTILVPASAYFMAAAIVDKAMSLFTQQMETMDAIAYAAANPNE